jgi:glutamyl-tRNA(Gln) amidotransferase subunit D
MMYSDKLRKVFEANSIEVGDVIRVESKALQFEGELMPKTEAGHENTIVIKLKSGYNAGVMYDDKVKITKVASGKATEFPLAKPKMAAGLPKVSLLWTGGTIGSKIEYKTGGVHMIVKPEELFYYVPELPSIANMRFNPICEIASEDMSYHEWQKIAEGTAAALNEGAHGVVITHGTDTMGFTAAALAFMLQNLNAPVVLTGSQRSSDRGSSDAFLNLIAATNLAANSNIAEVCICMHASSSDDRMHLLRGVKARKMHTSRRDAFRPINDRPIAYVDKEGKISYVSEYRKVEKGAGKVIANTNFEPKTALIKVYPNSDPEVMQYYMDKGYRGFILEGTGLGHMPVSTEHPGKSWLPYIKNAIGSGVVVGMTSQTLYGRVHANVYRNLRLLSNAGVVYCEDMLPETAYVKLGWLLGNNDNAAAKELLNKNLAGEITKRVNYDEFLV